MLFARSLFCALLFTSVIAQDDPHAYTQPFFPNATYATSVPTPEQLLGFQPGEKAAFPAQINACMQAWDKASERTRLVEYARSYEDRPLYYMIISHPDNMARLDDIQTAWNKLADPVGLSDADAQKEIDQLPAVAWMAYSIHGNETSGCDAALAVTYHLTAAQDEEVLDMLRDLVVIIDPNMNPDGRERTLRQVNEFTGPVPNLDDQSQQLSGYWPYGRTNHYFFDLNRDWILGVNPEARGRLKALTEWHPLLLVDAHEMGSQSTFLFSPPREPRNPHVPSYVFDYVDRFADAHGKAFDQKGWRYFTGEWNEDFYPGYSSNWGRFKGAVSILYEQARNHGQTVRLANGETRPFRLAVHHQVVSTMSNLTSLATHRKDLSTAFVDHRRKAIASSGPFARKTLAVPPTANRSRLLRFADLLSLQGFEVYETTEALQSDAKDRLGRQVTDKQFPKGTLLVPYAQPMAHMVAALLDFDVRPSDAFLQKEWEELMYSKRPTLYDTTSWSLTLMHDLDAYLLPMELPKNSAVFEGEAVPASTVADTWTALALQGTDDMSVVAAGRLMEAGLRLRVCTQTTRLGTIEVPRGSVLISREDHSLSQEELARIVRDTALELDLEVLSIGSGMGQGDLADIGGRYFPLLERPRIGILSRPPFSSYDVGTTWHLLQETLGIHHSLLNATSFGADLGRYNVLVLPDMNGALPPGMLDKLKPWVKNGGTLISIGGATSALAKEKGLGSVRQLPNVLEKLDDYELDLMREWMTDIPVQPDQVWSHQATGSGTYPWEGKTPKRESKEALARKDAWERIFMPRGTMLAGRVDQRQWLTFGLGEYVPVLFGNHPVLMAKNPTSIPVRLGYAPQVKPKPATGKKAKTTKPEKKEPKAVGWAKLPTDRELYLRMSGLLWPQAANRLANAAAVTRESMGKGQIIMFASPPNFRASTLGTRRILMNALVYGPGLGARTSIQPY